MEQPTLLYESGIENTADASQRKKKRRAYLDQIVDPLDSQAAMDAAQQANVTDESPAMPKVDTGAGEGVIDVGTGMAGGGGGASPFKFANQTGTEGEGQVAETGGILGFGQKSNQQQCFTLPDGTNSCSGQRVSQPTSSTGVMPTNAVGGTQAMNLPADASPDQLREFANKALQQGISSTDPNRQNIHAGIGLATAQFASDEAAAREGAAVELMGVKAAEKSIEVALQQEREKSVAGRISQLEITRNALLSGENADGTTSLKTVDDYVKQYVAYGLMNDRANETTLREGYDQAAAEKNYTLAGVRQALQITNAQKFNALTNLSVMYPDGSPEFDQTSETVREEIVRVLVDNGLANTEDDARKNFSIIAAPALQAGALSAIRSKMELTGTYGHAGQSFQVDKSKYDNDPDYKNAIDGQINAIAVVKGTALYQTMREDLMFDIKGILAEGNQRSKAVAAETKKNSPGSRKSRMDQAQTSTGKKQPPVKKKSHAKPTSSRKMNSRANMPQDDPTSLKPSLPKEVEDQTDLGPIDRTKNLISKRNTT
jgi:hypothetical protein